MGIRIAILVLHWLLVGTVYAQSLHLSPAGTVVSGAFELAGRTIPLPAGEFLLAAARIDETSVFLAQLDGQRLKSAVWASAMPSGQRDESRVDVERRLRSFGSEATGLLKDAADWLAYHDVATPVPVLVVAEITRAEGAQAIHAAYAFNPWSYGCNTSDAAFSESVSDWGKAVQRHFDNPTEGPASGIHQCVSAVARR